MVGISHGSYECALCFEIEQGEDLSFCGTKDNVSG